jgi:hypothetical protein
MIMALSVEGISTGSTPCSRYGFDDVFMPNEGLLDAAYSDGVGFCMYKRVGRYASHPLDYTLV